MSRHKNSKTARTARRHPQPEYGYANNHALVQEKIVPLAFRLLAEELAKPQNADLSARAIKGNSFEECLGILAADLSIALDGNYTPEDLIGIAEVLLARMRARNEPGFNGQFDLPSKTDARLKNVELVERAKEITLEEVGLALNTIAPGGAVTSKGPYTVCDSCTTSFECCFERDCKIGKPATQLGETMKVLKETLQ